MTETSNSHIDLDNFWPYQVVVLADQISRYTLSVVKDKANLNSSQWRVLAAVADKPGRSAAEVTSVTPMDKTIVSRAVASLIEIGLIQKSQTTLDKRRQALTMTPEGLKIHASISRELNRKLINDKDNGGSPDNFLKLLESYGKHMESIGVIDHSR